MELLLIRHGLPLRVDEGDTTGPADPALSDVGLRQASDLAAWLASERIDAIWCSPMRRARETAAPLAAGLSLPITVHDHLAEFDRDAGSYIPIEELKAANDPRWYELPERPEHFRDEVVGAMERIVGAHGGQRVAVICHGGVINAYAGHVLHIDEPLFFLPDYTSVSRVLAASTGERSIGSLNETPHRRSL